MTAYEKANGAKYSGRLCPFGEPVYAQIEPKQKGNPRWVLGIMVTFDFADLCGGLDNLG